MKRYGLIAAAALIVLTNVVVLAGVAYNRSGEPDSTVTLTERELHWRDLWNRVDREDSGLYLVLKWNMPGYVNYTEQPRKDNWMNQDKLKELGFDTGFPLTDKEATRYYNRQLPRQAFVVLEFEGGAYQNWLKEAKLRIVNIRQDLSEEEEPGKKKNLENNLRRVQQQLITQSHLFAVDAGWDAPVLRQKYSDRSKYIITSAVFDISMHYTSSTKDQTKSPPRPYLSGRVRNVSIPEIHVNSDYRSFFISDIKTHTTVYLPREKPLSDLEPRYRVTLNYGRRYEPWIVNIEQLK